MPLGFNELAARGAERQVEYRAEPLRLRVEWATLSTLDGLDLRCSLEFSVAVAESRADRELLLEVLLGDRDRLLREDVAAFISRRMLDVAAQFAAKSPVADLLDGAAREAFAALLRKSADSAAFSCGLLVLPPFTLDLESPGLQRAKVEQLQRARAEQRTADQVEHVRRAGELLRQFQTIREGTGLGDPLPGAGADLSPGRILQRIAPDDRGSALEALLLAGSGSSTAAQLWAVAGPYLVRVGHPEESAAGEAPRVRLSPLPSTLGPLRSVQPVTFSGRRMLLVGASVGVMLIDPESVTHPGEAPGTVMSFSLSPEQTSARGFNSAVLDEQGGAIWATHSDFGVVRWSLESREALPVSTPAPGAAPRNLTLLTDAGGGGVLVSCGPQLSRSEATHRAAFAPLPIPADGSDVVAIVQDGGRLAIIHEDGTIVMLDRASLEVVDRQSRPGAVVAAAALPWLSSVRLLLSRAEGAIECVGIDDQLVTQYLGPYRGCRMLAANASTVAAVTLDRQRVVTWASWSGRKPISDVHVVSHTRHRVADLTFG